MTESTLALLLAILIVAAIIYWLVSAKRPQRQGDRSSRSQTRVSSRARRELYALMNGDSAGAERLVEKARLRHPEKSEQWHWEKVIFDLKRDRRA